MQTAFTLVFFCAFREFVRIIKEKKRPRQSNDATDGEVPLIAMHTQGTSLYTYVHVNVCSYTYVRISKIDTGLWIIIDDTSPMANPATYGSILSTLKLLLIVATNFKDYF